MVVLLFLLSGLGAWSGEALAAAKFARSTGNWGTAGIWSSVSCATAGATTAPGAADDVTICSGVTVTIAANAAALSVVVQTGGTLTQATTRTLTIGNTLNVAGLFTCQNSLTVSGATTVSGTLTIANTAGAKTLTGDVTVSAGGTWNETAAEAISFGGSLTNSGTFTASTGVHTFTGAGKTFSGNPIAIPSVAVTGSYTNNTTLTVATALSGAGTLTNAASQALNIGGTSGITTLTATAAGNTVSYTANAAQTVKATTYYNLTKSGTGTATAGGNLTVNGTLTVSAGTLALAATTSQINGPTNVNGTLSMTTATKTFVGAVTVNAGGVWTSSATGTAIFRGGITHNGTTFTGGIGQFNTNSQALAGSSAMTFAGTTVTVTGAITVTNSNTNTVTITGNLNGSVAGSTFVNGANATLDYRGANAPMATGVLTANANPNTVIYGRGGAQAVRLPSAGYYHLTLSNSGIKTAPAGTLAVLGNLTVNAGPTFTANTNDPTLNVTGNVTVAGTYQSSSTAAALTIGGNLSVSGTYTGNGGPANLAGDFTRTGTFTSGAGVFTFNGSALQTLTGATTFTSLTVNNSGTGLSLASDITATTAAAGTLVLTAGPVATGSNNLIVPRSCTTPSVTRTGGWVAGNLRLAFPTGAPTCTFHVGDASNYRPIGMTFASVTTAGSLTGTVSQSAGEHPNIATSGLDSAKDVNRYWTLTNPGGIAFTTYTATFNFINPGDFDAGANPSYFEIERWDGSAWNTTTLGSAGATSTSASGLPSFGAGVSNSFPVGQKKPPTVVSINRADPDPATSGTSVNWTVTFSSSVTGVDSTDFTLVMGGGLSGATITGVAGGGTTWTVTADTGVGGGTLGLNLVDDDTIVNAASTPLGGAGAGNGNFTGQVYTVVATSSGFIFTDSACVHNIAIGAPGQTCALIGWSPQVAGQALTGVYITAVNTSGVPTRLHASAVRTRNIEFGLSCHNPVAHAGVQATFAGVTLPLCQGSGATPTTWSSTVTVTFPGGSPSSNTSYSFNYADVGLVELWMRNNATPAQTGSSGTFVVKPWGFQLAATCADSTVNAASQTSPSTSDPKFCRAGQNFNATVTAVTQTPAATPNYGKETTAETVAIAWSVQLPSGGASGTLPTGSLPFSGSGGLFGPPSTAFTWDEVGILKAVITVGDSNYLGAGNVTTTAYVGRFYPDHFDVVVTPQPNCNGFVYSGRPGGTVTPGQPFTVAATAKNGKASPTTTTNYHTTGGFSKNVNLTLTAGGTGVGNIYVDSTAGGSGAIPSSKFTAGVGQVNYNDVSGKISYVFDTFPTTATNITLHADDSESAISPMVAGTNGTTSARSGVLRLSNAYGSELVALRVPMRAEHYSGTAWVTNTDDDSGCSTLVSGNVSFGNYKGSLTPLSVGSINQISDGLGSIVLSTPAVTGSADMAINLGATSGDANCGTGIAAATSGAARPWLRGKWCGSNYDKDPAVRVRFGSAKAPYIYLRERY